MNIVKLTGLLFVSLWMWASWPTSLHEIVSDAQQLGIVTSQHTSAQRECFKKNTADLIRGCLRTVKPLKATRVEVEHLLGKPQKTSDSQSVYVTDANRVDILYSVGPCLASGVERWNVEKDVVIRVDIRPSSGLRVKDLKLDRRKYFRARESHPNNWFSYLNKDDGIRIETILSGKVEEVNSITIGPRPTDDVLRCPASNNR
jgi:hypothetical protein